MITYVYYIVTSLIAARAITVATAAIAAIMAAGSNSSRPLTLIMGLIIWCW